MPTREAGNRMPYRQGVSTYVHDQLYLRKVIHLDAFIWQTPDDNLYLVLETREGGQSLLARAVFRIERDYLANVLETLVPERSGIARYINSPWTRRHAPWLAEIHTRYVSPEIARLRASAPRLSVRLWYVWNDPRIDEPCDGIENLYSVTGYATHAPIVDRPTRNKASTWNARERSLLRTLDKLLK